jgi:hypothetical protein
MYSACQSGQSMRIGGPFWIIAGPFACLEERLVAVLNRFSDASLVRSARWPTDLLPPIVVIMTNPPFAHCFVWPLPHRETLTPLIEPTPLKTCCGTDPSASRLHDGVADGFRPIGATCVKVVPARRLALYSSPIACSASAPIPKYHRHYSAMDHLHGSVRKVRQSKAPRVSETVRLHLRVLCSLKPDSAWNAIQRGRDVCRGAKR